MSQALPAGSWRRGHPVRRRIDKLGNAIAVGVRPPEEESRDLGRAAAIRRVDSSPLCAGPVVRGGVPEVVEHLVGEERGGGVRSSLFAFWESARTGPSATLDSQPSSLTRRMPLASPARTSSTGTPNRRSPITSACTTRPSAGGCVPSMGDGSGTRCAIAEPDPAAVLAKLRQSE